LRKPLLAVLLAASAALAGCQDKVHRPPCPTGQVCLEYGNNSEPLTLDPQKSNLIDEFVIIALGTNKDQARMAAERKRKEISEKDFQIGRTDLVKITVSCGIAEGNPESDTPESILERANKALLTAKGLGKNKSITYEG